MFKKPIIGACIRWLLVGGRWEGLAAVVHTYSAYIIYAK